MVDLVILPAKRNPNNVFADSVDHDQTAYNVQSDLGSTLAVKEIIVPQEYLWNNFEISSLVILLFFWKFLFTFLNYQLSAQHNFFLWTMLIRVDQD